MNARIPVVRLSIAKRGSIYEAMSQEPSEKAEVDEIESGSGKAGCAADWDIGG